MLQPPWEDTQELVACIQDRDHHERDWTVEVNKTNIQKQWDTLLVHSEPLGNAKLPLRVLLVNVFCDLKWRKLHMSLWMFLTEKKGLLITIVAFLKYHANKQKKQKGGLVSTYRFMAPF
jgi:hypothetical protein